MPGGEPGSILKRISATLHIIVATLHWPLSPHYSNGTIAGIIPQLVLLLFILPSSCSGCSYLLIHKLVRGIFYPGPFFYHFHLFLYIFRLKAEVPLKSIVTVQCPSMINTQNEQSNIPSAYVLELNHMDQNIKEFDCLRLYVCM